MEYQHFQHTNNMAGNMMELYDGQIHRCPPAVVAALLDLARLAQNISATVREAPGSIAPRLVERIAALCNADRGAILLTTQYLAGQSASETLSLKKVFRHFALLGMSEEEALLLLPSFSLDGSAVQTSPGSPCWVMCTLPVSAPLTLEPAALSPDDTTTPPQFSTMPYHALLLLGDKGEDDCGAFIEKAQSLLPPVLDAVGSVVLTTLLAERVHELEIMTDRKALREMELLKAELLGTVSHELRSPLASVKGYAATLLRHERRISREERHEFLLAINEASDRLEVVINRLLEMSQLETGSIAIAPTPVNLLHLAREAIIAIEQRLSEPAYQERTSTAQERLRFSIRVEDENNQPTNVEPIIQADRSRLREVLDNLLENAINYSPDGGAVEIVIRPLVEPPLVTADGEPALQPAAKQMMEICVHDSGIGIPPGQLRLIFDRFHRVDTRLTREVNGLGLGLAICKRIVEMHGGMIWAESDLGKGSTFHVWLPMLPDA
ncbi:MAG TPA: HAMP domain-containing sensor histidine kinase [Ktedonosporobacter sp.]|jgi:signal transduction histidine kinase|nr:HAMP domain-containing sensor histidine kinase [Ktedonosporobacter sp.]